MNRTLADKWLIRFKPRSQATLRLICFPYAGAGAMVYRTWADDLPAEIDVCAIQLPGRETRFSEPSYRSLAELLDPLAVALAPALDRPFAIFGHSLGALIGFELARHIRRQFDHSPLRLMISARRAPHLSPSRPPIHQLPEPEFIDGLQAYGGLPQAILEDEELRRLYLPILRADFALFETYRYQPERAFDFPLSVFGGEQDPTLDEADLREWQAHTTQTARLRLFQGNHFYLQSDRAQLLRAIAEDLTGDPDP